LEIDLILTKSTPRIHDETDILLRQTCIHEPGAQHKSNTTEELSNNLYLEFICNNLNDALDL